MKFEMKNPYSSKPPGSHLEYIPHPAKSDDICTYKAIFKEHRFAFYWWNKLTQKRREKTARYRADLITFDFHNDLFEPSVNDIEELSKLNLNIDFDVSFYSWARLNGNSDDHILSAAYLNLIGNVYALTFNVLDEPEFIFKDMYANEHKVFVSNDLENFSKKIISDNIDNIFLDIDLDFFIEKEGLMGQKETWELMKSEEIDKCINLENDLFKSIFNKIDCLTIALEPSYTGSFENSLRNFQEVQKRLFKDNGDWLK